MTDSTKRFSNRVADYVKYRPNYPREIIATLEKNGYLKNGAVVADIGAGTGISAELFLEKSYTVTGVEPNKEMREQSVVMLNKYPQFKAIDGSAEDTTLDANSIDLVVAAQAFHWFNRERTLTEFERILKPGGSAALLWNERLTETDFEKEYEQLIVTHGNQYQKVDHRNISDDAIETFFAPKPVRRAVFANQQVFNYEGLKGRLLSSSYMPAKGDAGYENMIADLKILFYKFQTNKQVVIHYTTKLYCCRLK